MEYTVIHANGDIKDIVFSEITPEIEKDIEEINSFKYTKQKLRATQLYSPVSMNDVLMALGGRYDDLTRNY